MTKPECCEAAEIGRRLANERADKAEAERRAALKALEIVTQAGLAFAYRLGRERSLPHADDAYLPG